MGSVTLREEKRVGGDPVRQFVMGSVRLREEKRVGGDAVRQFITRDGIRSA